MKDSLMINSVVKTFQLLDCLVDSDDGLTLTELSKKMPISMGAAQRITHTLAKIGYLKKDPRTKTFTLTPKWLALGYSFLNKSEMREIALPYLKELNQLTNETVNLAVISDENEIVYIERVQTSHIITTNIRPGKRRPIYATSIGKVILAFTPEAERKAIMEHIALNPEFTKTGRKIAELEDDVRIISNIGYSTNLSELDNDLVAAAVPILNHEGRAVAGINIVIPKTRASMKIIKQKYIPSLVYMGQRISENMGYSQKS